VLRSVDSPHYHLWTDALHARHLARNAKSAWDLGSYVRWTVIASWTAFESTCEDVLHVSGLGNRFKEKLDATCNARGIAPLTWGSGLWQGVLTIYGFRKDYIHKQLPQSRLFAPLSEAEDSIKVLRAAIKDIYGRAGAPPPEWVDDDENPIDPELLGGFTMVAHGTLIQPGANPSDPHCIRLCYLYKGKEYDSEILPPGSEPERRMKELLRRVAVPISAVRAYRGENLLDEWQVNMRGN
jgi:hypothetical protein